ESYLADLVRLAGEGLHRIYGCCLNYPADGPFDRTRLAAYLRDRVVRPNAYYVGNAGLSAERIRREAALRERLEQELDSLERAGKLGRPPHEIRRQLQDAVSCDSRFEWARSAEPSLSLLERVLPYLPIAGLVVGGVLLLPVLLPAGLGTLLLLDQRERSDPEGSGPVADHHLEQLLAQEDQPGVLQNHMAKLAQVKPGRFRRGLLSLVLWLANRVARVSTDGTLSGIPTIHFAHWSMIDGGQRLLFLSNYDGSWGSYLDDFIDKASDGLTLIWSNTVGFPRSHYRPAWRFPPVVITGGTSDGPRFKANSRAHMVPTNVRHTLYPDLTVQQINRNRDLRNGLFAKLDPAGERKWLRYL
ncbi:MAG: hypothetical protein ACJ73J_12900, partial [Actinomycetes bacterium]